MTRDDHFLLAVRHYQDGLFDESRRLAAAILDRDPAAVRALNLLGMSLHQLNRSEEAIELLEKAIAIDPTYAAAPSNLAAVYKDKRRPADALGCIRRTLDLEPDVAEHHLSKGVLEFELGRMEEALESCARAINLDSALPDAFAVRARILDKLSRHAEARDNLLAALRLDNTRAEFHNSFGNTLRQLNLLPESLSSYEQAIALSPDFAEALNNRGAVLYLLGRRNEALQCLADAISARPDYVDPHSNRGMILMDAGDLEDALAAFDRAIALDASAAPTHYNRGQVLSNMGFQAGALDAFRCAAELAPEWVEPRWVAAMAKIPKIQSADADPLQSRTNFLNDLRSLEEFCDAHDTDGKDVVGSSTPFFLTYQDLDNRDLLSTYGKLCTKLMGRWQEKQPPPAPIPRYEKRKIRVGIVSAHIHDQSVWHAITRGWLAHIDRTRFEIHVFYPGEKQDGETAWASRTADAFEHGKKSLSDWVNTITGHGIDVLLYPEVGMDNVTVKLASLRLARVQACAWGHPDTSGIPTIDYYLSAQEFELPDARNYYSERLITLPGVGTCCAPFGDSAVAPDFAALRLKQSVPLLVCAGTPFKYSPRHDQIFVEIARTLGQCQFIFFNFKLREMSNALKRRLDETFARAGMRFSDFAVFLPWQSPSQFRGILEASNVFLDTIGFSGFNTALQALESNLPIVTQEGQFLRGRLASGILRKIGMPDLIAPTSSAYIDLAVRLCRDTKFCQSVRARANLARTSIYNDMSVVRALEDHLLAFAAHGLAPIARSSTTAAESEQNSRQAHRK